jgi:hypothetical protein
MEHEKPKDGNWNSCSNEHEGSSIRTFSIYDFLEGNVENMEQKTFRLLDQN